MLAQAKDMSRKAIKARLWGGTKVRVIPISSPLSDAQAKIAALEKQITELRDPPRDRVPYKAILTAVAEYYNLTIEELLSENRSYHITRPRQIAMYIGSKMSKLSLAEIGRRTGDKDHTTVLHAVRVVGRRRAENEVIDHQIKTLCRQLRCVSPANGQKQCNSPNIATSTQQ